MRFFWGAGGANKVHYGKCGSGVLLFLLGTQREEREGTIGCQTGSTLCKSIDSELYLLKLSHKSHFTAWLAQLGERRSAEREVAGSNPGRTNTQGL